MEKEVLVYRDDLIRAAMAAKRISNDELAELSGVSRTSVARLRSGSSENPTVQNLAAIAKVLDIPLHELFVPAEPGKEAVA
jgi:transcriptional regulator with XRE-family HTH domain